MSTSSFSLFITPFKSEDNEMPKYEVREILTPQPNQLAGEQFSKNTILISQGIEPKEVIALASRNGLSNLVQKDAANFDEELELAQLMQNEPKKFIQNPLQAILNTTPNPQQLFTFSCTAGVSREEFMDRLMGFVGRRTKPGLLKEELRDAADELFTNGAKNSAKITVADTKVTVEILAYVDATRLILLCIDSFGLLVAKNLLKGIDGCFSEGIARSIRQDTSGGAGIGSFMIFNSCSSYYIGVEEGVRTIVGCAYQTIPRLRERTEISKNIHVLTV